MLPIWQQNQVYFHQSSDGVASTPSASRHKRERLLESLIGLVGRIHVSTSLLGKGASFAQTGLV